MSKEVIISGGYAKLPCGYISESYLMSMYSLLMVANKLLPKQGNVADYAMVLINRKYITDPLPESEITMDNMRKKLRHDINQTNPKYIHKTAELWGLDLTTKISYMDLYAALTNQDFKDIETETINNPLARIKKLLEKNPKIPEIKLEKLEFPTYSKSKYPSNEIDISEFAKNSVIGDFAELFNAKLAMAYYLYDIEAYYNQLAINISKLADEVRKTNAKS